jgi:hypothetical protein
MAEHAALSMPRYEFDSRISRLSSISSNWRAERREQLSFTQRVGGSSPSWRTFARMAKLVYALPLRGSSPERLCGFESHFEYILNCGYEGWW